MDNAFLLYGSAIAASSFAATLVPGPATWAIPVTIGVLANSPDAQSRLASNWGTSAKELTAAHQALAKTKRAGYPQEWSAGDREAFEKRVDTLMDQVTKAKDIVDGASQTMRLSSTASQVCAYVCMAAAGVMLTAAYAASMSATAGPAGLMGGQMAARFTASKVLTAVSGVLRKQSAMYGTAAGILVLGASWHGLQLYNLKSQISSPEGGKPDFKQVSLEWK
ncbi:hypothetical protein [Nonomuraea cavernae]|uniref:hypothetical protein n=1 Tax=Nonomuraea cavernae TaxID=2045107 RepID=UPI0033D6452E